MDAANKKQHQDSRRFRPAACLAVLLSLASSTTGFSQVARTAPETRGEVLVHHPGNQGAMLLPAESWRIQNSAFPNGCLVSWTAEPFTHENNQKLQVDCELNIALDAGTPNAEWKAVTPTSITSFSRGKGRAVVEVASARRGNARALLQVRFVPQNNFPLAGGRYSTVVTGTVTGL